METLSREELLEARIAGLETRITQMEGWTGADEDGDPMADNVSVAEELLVLRKLVTHLIRMLDFTFPNFSVDRFRRTLAMVDAHEAELARKLVEDLPEIDPGWNERTRSIIEDHLPIPVPNDLHPPKQRRTFRPTLVRNENDEAPSEPENGE